MSDQPENASRPLPPGYEQKGLITDAVIPAAIAAGAGFGNGVGKVVGEAIVAKLPKPQPPQDK